MKKLTTPDQFKNPLSLTVIGIVGMVLGCSLTVRAFDTGSGWQYLGAILLFTLSVRLFIRAIRTKQK